MKLSLYFDYSLRVLIYLARRPDQTITINEIAGFFAISRNHLVKVVHELGRQGYVHTARGKHGGLRLARAPGQIVIGEVTRRMESDFRLFECFDPAASRCRIAGSCAMKRVAQDAVTAFLATLDQYTLADLTPAPEQRLPTARLADIPALPAAAPGPGRRPRA